MRPVSPFPCAVGLWVVATGHSTLAAAPLELEQVVIEGQQQSELESAAQRLREVPGATNLIDMQRVEQGRVATNQDVLAYQPGVLPSRPATMASNCRSAAQASIAHPVPMALVSTRCSTACR